MVVIGIVAVVVVVEVGVRINPLLHLSNDTVQQPRDGRTVRANTIFPTLGKEQKIPERCVRDNSQR